MLRGRISLGGGGFSFLRLLRVERRGKGGLGDIQYQDTGEHVTFSRSGEELLDQYPEQVVIIYRLHTSWIGRSACVRVW